MCIMTVKSEKVTYGRQYSDDESEEEEREVSTSALMAAVQSTRAQTVCYASTAASASTSSAVPKVC